MKLPELSRVWHVFEKICLWITALLCVPTLALAFILVQLTRLAGDE